MTSLFELSLGGFVGDLRVVGFEGSEAMNRLYRFDIRLTVPGADAAGFAEKALEMPATLTMRFGAGDHRTVHGVVTACQAVGRSKSGLVLSSLRLEPRMALLRRRRTSRIFQDLSTREIVSAVLSQRSIAQRWRLGRELPKRAYAVQYDETDHAFVTRLLAEDGLMFSFDQPRELGGDGTNTGTGRTEVVVITDTAESYAPIDGVYELPFRGPDHDGMVQDEEHIHGFSLRHRVRSKGVLLRGFDAEKPPLTPRDAATTEGAPRIDRPEAMRTLARQDMTIYEPQHTREEALTQPVLAANYLEAERATARIADGRSACRRLLPGRKLRLIEHELPEVDGEYVVVSCDHVGWAPEAAPDGAAIYRNEFTCAPADVPQRPRRPRSKPRQTLETAVVTGPAGQEIHTDELGRIKVQFHWDLDGQLDERSSCWLRVAQAWAGAGFGAQFIPRVGMEVLVGFIAGDPDRPVVTGCLYNGTQPTPFRLPEDQGKSGIRSRSTPGGVGFNELVFDDQAGAESVALRSQGNLAVASRMNQHQAAGGDLVTTVDGARTDTTGGQHTATIGSHESIAVAGSSLQSVGESALLKVLGKRTVVVGKEEDKVIGTGQTVRIGESSLTTVGSAASPGVVAVDVHGTYSLQTSAGILITSRERVEIAVGKSRIIMDKDSIRLSSPRVLVESDEQLYRSEDAKTAFALGSDVSLKTNKFAVASSGASLVLDSEAKLDGALVKLNCGGASIDARAQSLGSESGVAIFKVVNYRPDDGHLTLLVMHPDGECREHAVDPEGTLRLDGKPGEHFTLMEMRQDGITVASRKVENS